MLHLIFLSIGSEFLYSIRLRDVMTNDLLVLLSKFAHLLFNLWEVILRDCLTLCRHHVIEETILNSWSESELNAWVKLLQSLCKEVGRSVPEGVLTFFVIELVQCDGSVLIDRTIEFCCFAIYTARYNVTGESRRNALGDLKTSYALLVFTNGTVWESDFNHTTN